MALPSFDLLPLDIGVEDALRRAGLPQEIVNAPPMTLPEELDMERPLRCLAPPAQPPTPEPVTAPRRLGGYPRDAGARARTLLQYQLTLGAQIEAAARIPERSLILMTRVGPWTGYTFFPT